MPASDATPVGPGSRDHLRPVYHFTARRTWLNDPNGLVYHRGTYHLFFQCNPAGGDWGNMSWGHATSTDLVHWVEKPVAIEASAEEYVFSGSAVVDHANSAGFAGAGETALVAVYTSHYREASGRPGIQAQSLAYSLDDGVTWVRHRGNPVLDRDMADFRDPKVFWFPTGDGAEGQGGSGHWVMVTVESVEKRVAIFTSPNLLDWEFTSHFGPAHAVEGIWECPDLFPLPVEGTERTRWVLVVSLNPGSLAGGSGTQYFVGDFDGGTFTAERLADPGEPRDYDWLDFGRDYYAAVSFNGVPDGRRLMIGWVSNWDYAVETPTAPWRSAMSLVREVRLVPDGDRHRIVQRPVLPERPLDPRVLEADLALDVARGVVSEVVVTGGADGEEVVLTLDGDRRTLALDRTRSGDVAFHETFPSVDVADLPGSLGARVDIQILVDGCTVEVFAAGGLVTFAQLVFPSRPFTRIEVRARQP